MTERPSSSPPDKPIVPYDPHIYGPPRPQTPPGREAPSVRQHNGKTHRPHIAFPAFFKNIFPSFITNAYKDPEREDLRSRLEKLSEEVTKAMYTDTLERRLDNDSWRLYVRGQAVRNEGCLKRMAAAVEGLGDEVRQLRDEVKVLRQVVDKKCCGCRCKEMCKVDRLSASEKNVGKESCFISID